MTRIGWAALSGVVLGLIGLIEAQASVTVSVSATASHPIPTTLCKFGNPRPMFKRLNTHAGGYMFEASSRIEPLEHCI